HVVADLLVEDLVLARLHRHPGGTHAVLQVCRHGEGPPVRLLSPLRERRRGKQHHGTPDAGSGQQTAHTAILQSSQPGAAAAPPIRRALSTISPTPYLLTLRRAFARSKSVEPPSHQPAIAPIAPARYTRPS